MWYCRGEVWGGWDLSGREQREQWEQEEGKYMAGADTGNVSLDQCHQELFGGISIWFL